MSCSDYSNLFESGFNVTDVVDFPTGKLGVEKSAQDNKAGEKEAA